MPLKRKEPQAAKAAVIEELTGKLRQCKAAVVTTNAGLTVEEVTALRAQLYKEKVELHVVKNTLAKLALGKAQITVLDDLMAGPTAIALAMGDAIAPARVLSKFAKEHEKLSIRGGWLDGKKVTDKDLKAIANLPSREVLIAKALGSMNAPITGFVRVLSGPARKLVYALSAIRDAKAKTA